MMNLFDEILRGQGAPGGGGGGGIEVVNLIYNESEDCYYSEKTRNEIKAMVESGKQCVYYDGYNYSDFIDWTGSAAILTNRMTANTGNYRVGAEYYATIIVDNSTKEVTLTPCVGVDEIIIGARAYRLSVETDGTLRATELTSSDVADE